MQTNNSNTNCLCGKANPYQSCCEPFHLNTKTASTAEELMRSRFTAYAMQHQQYLLATWDIATRPEEVDFSKEQAVWTSLEIVSVKKGTKKDKKGLVEFKAFYTLENEEYVMVELSRFKQIEHHWVYVDGIVKSVGKVNQQTNQGKNAPCSCGSGKKYKRCCGK